VLTKENTTFIVYPQRQRTRLKYESFTKQCWCHDFGWRVNIYRRSPDGSYRII